MVYNVGKLNFFVVVRWLLFSWTEYLAFVFKGVGYGRCLCLFGNSFLLKKMLVARRVLKEVYSNVGLKARSVSIGCFLCFFLEGVYFRVRFYKSLRSLCFLLGYSQYVCISVPRGIHLSMYSRKRRVILFGFDKMLLTSFVSRLFDLKKLDVYRGKGFRLFAAGFSARKLVKKR